MLQRLKFHSARRLSSLGMELESSQGQIEGNGEVENLRIVNVEIGVRVPKTSKSSLGMARTKQIPRQTM